MEEFTYNQSKKRSWKFWITFWLVAAFLLCAWAVFLKVRQDGALGLLSWVKPVVQVLPADEQRKKELLTIFDMIPDITKDDREKTYLILFQNNTELRPGGGFIGSFGILKTKGQKVTFIDTHDTNIVDNRIVSNIEPPYPMGKMLNIKNWELRDSNWSPDFPTNAQKAEEFYHMEQGTEQFDGVVAVSTEVLESFLKITGPVTIEGYPGEYNSENAVIKLEYQVERGYIEQGIDKGERKYVMKKLAKVLIDKAQSLSFSEQKQLIETIETHLNNRDITIYFKDQTLQERMQYLGWSGEVLTASGDYLMMVDANLAALKSDQFMQRSFDYTVDFTKEKPQANLKITYEHTAKEKDWMTTDYNSYLRVYVPEGSWLQQASGTGDQTYGSELGKKFFGFLVKIPLGQTKTVGLTYDLPSSINSDTYSLLVQKQSGVGLVPGAVHVIDKNGVTKTYNFDLTGQWKLEE